MSVALSATDLLGDTIDIDLVQDGETVVLHVCVNCTLQYWLFQVLWKK